MVGFFVWEWWYVVYEAAYGPGDVDLLSGTVEIFNGDNKVVASIHLYNVCGVKVLLKAGDISLLEDVAEKHESVGEFLHIEGGCVVQLEPAA